MMEMHGCRAAVLAAAWALAATWPLSAQDVSAPRDTARDTAAVAPPADKTPAPPPYYPPDLLGGDLPHEPAGISRAFAASPTLPFEHWAVQAARRAEAMGLTRFFPAQRAVPRAQVADALADAAANGFDPAVRRLAEGWQARFREEFPEYT
ncbi:MAG TPA: hypothetical protein VF541_06345, partial [Longimicrobium sp.]